MPRHLHIDFETFSTVDLKAVGAYRYAYDPSTEIICAAMAFESNEPVAWWQGIKTHEIHQLTPYWDALEDPDTLIYAHNAMFEMAICQALMEKTWNIKCPDLSRFRCTMSLARRAALPASLEKLALELGLKDLKDAKGKSLIRKFSIMQPAKHPTKANPDGLPPRRIHPHGDPVAFGEFVDYCKQDVRVEQAVALKLGYFDEPINNANYSLDARINARGVTVNVEALKHAQKLIEEETEEVGKAFRYITGFEITQNQRLLSWVNERGANLPNLQAETVEEFLDNQPAPIIDSCPVRLVLKMKQAMAYTSIKKVATMLACHGPHDNRIRGTLIHHGATTGRWTASLTQFQNMKRATIKHTEDAYRDICEGASREWIDLCYRPPLEVISSCIRHFVQDEGGMLLDADYAAIEARIVAWLAGQEDALEEYRQGVDRYKRMASFIYGIDESEVNRFPQRYVGKSAILGCGYGMGPSKFRDTVKKQGGYDLPLGLEETAVRMYRAKNKKIASLWYDSEDAAKRAILSKNKAFKAGKVTFLHRDVEGLPFLLMRLPSGRKLAYPRPRISNDRVTFFGNIKGSTWGDVHTWGGSLVENATQAVAADIMAHGAHNVENAGYEIATLIHDQALAYHKTGQTPEEFVRLLTDLPPWAEGLPIAAEGSLVPFYRKD